MQLAAANLFERTWTQHAGTVAEGAHLIRVQTYGNASTIQVLLLPSYPSKMLWVTRNSSQLCCACLPQGRLEH